MTLEAKVPVFFPTRLTSVSLIMLLIFSSFPETVKGEGKRGRELSSGGLGAAAQSLVAYTKVGLDVS